MKGRDITKLSAWRELEAMGFRPIRFKGQMGFFEIGAALSRDGSEVLTIEPQHYRDMGPVWHVSVGGRPEQWKPQPDAPLSRYDTSGNTYYTGPQRYVPQDRPFGGYYGSRGLVKPVRALVAELA